MTAVAALILFLWIAGTFVLFAIAVMTAIVLGAVYAARPAGRFVLWSATSSYGWITRERYLRSLPPRPRGHP